MEVPVWYMLGGWYFPLESTASDRDLVTINQSTTLFDWDFALSIPLNDVSSDTTEACNANGPHCKMLFAYIFGATWYGYCICFPILISWLRKVVRNKSWKTEVLRRPTSSFKENSNIFERILPCLLAQKHDGNGDT